MDIYSRVSVEGYKLVELSVELRVLPCVGDFQVREHNGIPILGR
jgi:hypothetical protein